MPSNQSHDSALQCCAATIYTAWHSTRRGCLLGLYLRGQTTKEDVLTLVTVELSQVLEKLVSVTHQDFHYWASLVGIGNKYLHGTQIASP